MEMALGLLRLLPLGGRGQVDLVLLAEVRDQMCASHRVRQFRLYKDNR